MSRPVEARDVELMANRLADSVHDRVTDLFTAGVDSPGYLRARGAARRQRKALRRLTEALQQQLRELRHQAEAATR